MRIQSVLSELVFLGMFSVRIYELYTRIAGVHLMVNIFQQITGELCPLKGGNDNLNNFYVSGRLHLNGIMA